MKKILLLCIVISLAMIGCGDGTSGTLSVSAPVATNGVVTATATFSPSNGTALPGQNIDFRWYTVGITSKSKSAEVFSSGRTDKAGIVTSQYTLPIIKDESLLVYVIATTAGLTNKEGWQSVQVDP